MGGEAGLRVPAARLADVLTRSLDREDERPRIGSAAILSPMASFACLTRGVVGVLPTRNPDARCAVWAIAPGEALELRAAEPTAVCAGAFAAVRGKKDADGVPLTAARHDVDDDELRVACMCARASEADRARDAAPPTVAEVRGKVDDTYGVARADALDEMEVATGKQTASAAVDPTAVARVGEELGREVARNGELARVAQAIVIAVMYA